MSVEATTAGPFDSVEYLEDDYREIFGARYITRNGVIFGVDNGLQLYADSSGMQVKVKTGMFYIDGTTARWTGESILPIATWTTNRVDRVVVRYDSAANTVVLDVLTGSSTTPPSLTQNTSIWEESLGQVDVDTNATIAAGKITDERTGAAARGGLINCMLGLRPPHLAGRPIIERDTNRVRFSNGTDWLWAGGAIIGANLARSTTLSIAHAAWAACTLPTENWDTTATMHASSDAHVSIPEDGLYRATLTVTWASASSAVRQLGFHKAGSAWSSGTPSHTGPSDGTGVTQQFVYTFDCAAGDKITAMVRQDQNSGSAALNVATANFDVVLVGTKS